MRKVVALFCVFALASAASAATLYSSDFEADDGGWVASADWDPVGDWEWGVPTFVDGPDSAYSGEKCWGTVLDGLYTNAGGRSFLRQTFDFSGWTDMELSFWQWKDVFGSFDYTEILVNGDVVFGENDSAVHPWEQKTVDLSAYDGLSSVEISFELYATTVVNYAGWYIDDVALTGIPEPGTLALFGLCGLGLLRRR